MVREYPAGARFIASSPEDGGEIRDKKIDLLNEAINKVKNFQNSAGREAGSDQARFREIMKEKLYKLGTVERDLVEKNISQLDQGDLILSILQEFKDEYKSSRENNGRTQAWKEKLYNSSESNKSTQQDQKNKPPKSPLEDLKDSAREAFKDTPFDVID